MTARPHEYTFHVGMLLDIAGGVILEFSVVTFTIMREIATAEIGIILLCPAYVISLFLIRFLPLFGSDGFDMLAVFLPSLLRFCKFAHDSWILSWLCIYRF